MLEVSLVVLALVLAGGFAIYLSRKKEEPVAPAELDNFTYKPIQPMENTTVVGIAELEKEVAELAKAAVTTEKPKKEPKAKKESKPKKTKAEIPSIPEPIKPKKAKKNTT